MHLRLGILGLLFCTIFLISCKKEVSDSEKYETYLKSNEFIKQGLIAYYPFNGNTLDYSGNQFDGIDNNIDFSEDRFGNANRACKLSSMDSYVVIPNNQKFNKGEYTICFWYRADTVNDEIDRAILSKTDTLEGYAITTSRINNQSNNRFKKIMYYNGEFAYSSWKVINGSISYQKPNEPEKFQFTAISFSDTVFINHSSGERLTDKFNVPLTFIENNFDLLIGKSYLPGLSCAKGEIDDLLIYNRLLDIEEVIKLSKWKK